MFQVSAKSYGMSKSRAYIRWSPLWDYGPIYFRNGNGRPCSAHRLQVSVLLLLLSLGVISARN